MEAIGQSWQTAFPYMEPVLVRWPHSSPPAMLLVLCSVYLPGSMRLVFMTPHWELWNEKPEEIHVVQCGCLWGNKIKGRKSMVWKTEIFHFYPSVEFEPILSFVCLFVCISLCMCVSGSVYVLSGYNLATDWFRWKAPERMKRLYANGRVKASRKMTFKTMNSSVLGSMDAIKFNKTKNQNNLFVWQK